MPLPAGRRPFDCKLITCRTPYASQTVSAAAVGYGHRSFPRSRARCCGKRCSATSRGERLGSKLPACHRLRTRRAGPGGTEGPTYGRHLWPSRGPCLHSFELRQSACSESRAGVGLPWLGGSGAGGGAGRQGGQGAVCHQSAAGSHPATRRGYTSFHAVWGVNNEADVQCR